MTSCFPSEILALVTLFSWLLGLSVEASFVFCVILECSISRELLSLGA